MAKIKWIDGEPVLVYGDSEKEDDWIKNANPKAAKEDIEIHEALDKKNKEEKKED